MRALGEGNQDMRDKITKNPALDDLLILPTIIMVKGGRHWLSASHRPKTQININLYGN